MRAFFIVIINTPDNAIFIWLLHSWVLPLDFAGVSVTYISTIITFQRDA